MISDQKTANIKFANSNIGSSDAFWLSIFCLEQQNTKFLLTEDLRTMFNQDQFERTTAAGS